MKVHDKSVGVSIYQHMATFSKGRFANSGRTSCRPSLSPPSASAGANWDAPDEEAQEARDHWYT